MKNKVYEIMHPNTGKKLTERSRGPYQDYADCIEDDYSMYDGDGLIYDELDVFTKEELEEYILEEKTYEEFSAQLYRVGYEFREWYKTYSEEYDISFKYEK
jgi:hypothetical protein